MIPLLDLKAQYQFLQKEMDDAVLEHIRSTKYINGPAVSEFEQRFSSMHSVAHGIGCANGTAALHLAFEALGIGEGDEVIVSPMTFIATIEPLRQVGAKPVFVDVDPESYNMDETKIGKAITPATKAIIAVHLHGNPCRMDKIMQLVDQYNLIVIEDCAQAHLAEFKKKTISGFGDVSTFSFFPGKNLGAYGDAGMALTNDQNIAEKIRLLVNHGRSKKYEHIIEGYNYRMDTLQAVVLNVKLQYLSQWTDQRIRNAKIYADILSNMEIQSPQISEDKKHVFHVYAIVSEYRDSIAVALKQKGVASGIHYPIPLHLQPAYKYLGYKKGDFPIAEKLANEFLSLPIYPELAEKDIHSICDVIKNTLATRV